MTDKIKQLAETIARISKTEYYEIKIEPDQKPGIFDSKIGGLPYWTPDQKYPTDSQNKKLLLLAQINFDKEKAESPLPTEGMLQFFIRDDDLMGIDFDNQIKQDGFRVVYHEKIDYDVKEESLQQYKIENIECSPVFGEFKITLHKDFDTISYEDFQFDKYFALAYKEVYGKELGSDEHYYKVFNDEDNEKFTKEIEKLNPAKTNHQMLGYSYFTQEDPRYNEKYKDYETLLLQLDSEGDYIMWGDVGVGNFFIRKESLLKKDFSDVMFNWDCC